MPIVGYAIIWNNQISLLEYAHLGDKLWFDPIDRLHLIYWGGILVAVGWLLFRVFCPAEIRQYSSSSLLKSDIISSGDTAALQRIRKTIISDFETEYGPIQEFHNRKGCTEAIFRNQSAYLVSTGLAVTESGKDLASTIRGEYGAREIGALVTLFYEHQDRSRPLAAGLTFAFYGVGFLAFLVPSFEVFVLVLRSLVFQSG